MCYHGYVFWNRKETAPHLVERIVALEAEVRALKRDLADVEDKAFHMLKRNAKRARVEETEAPVEHPAVARIMARRSRGANGIPESLPSGGR